MQRYMSFPHEPDGGQSATTNTIVFHEAGQANLTADCNNVGPGQSFFVAIGEAHGALPDPLTFAALLVMTDKDSFEVDFYGWKYVNCSDPVPSTLSLDVTAGVEIQVAVLATPGQPFPATWEGALQIHFTPDREGTLLRAAQVKHYRAGYNLGSLLSDGKMPASWIFPLRQCSYGMLTILCPNQPKSVLAFEYGRSFMDPSMCHNCQAKVGLLPKLDDKWEDIEKSVLKQAMKQEGALVEGSKVGGFGVKVSAQW